MEKNKTKVKLRRAKTPDNKNRNYTKNEILIEYIKLNKQSFQFLQNKNFALAKVYFSKTIEISKEIDHIKYIESLINYSLCLYYNNEILLSYNSFKNAYDLSSVDFYVFVKPKIKLDFVSIRVADMRNILISYVQNLKDYLENPQKFLDLINVPINDTINLVVDLYQVKYFLKYITNCILMGRRQLRKNI